MRIFSDEAPERIPLRTYLEHSGMKGRAAGIVMSLIAVGLVLSFIFGEIGVRLASRRAIWFDVEMWKYAQTVKRDSEIYDIGHEHRPKRSEKLMGVDLETNSIGLRNREISPLPSPGTYRILALGDSLTLGWGVESNETFAIKLEQILNKKPPNDYKRVEVINAGVGNYNTSQEVAYYLNRGVRL